MPNETATTAWKDLTQYNAPNLSSLFAQDANRLQKYSFECEGLYFDFSKTHLDNSLLEIFQKLAAAKGLEDHIAALLNGEIINPSEDRAAEHSAERGVGRGESVAMAKTLHKRMETLISAIQAEAFGEIKHIIHLGIGGSALGPQLLLEALSLGDEPYETAVISNIDGCALEPVLERFDAQKTLLVIASKSFTTAETFLNAQSVISWMQQEGVSDPFGRIIALTAKPDAAIAWGIDESRILPFSETVGGRYSLWSSIGFSVALTLGYANFEMLLDGAKAMDEHFRDTAIDRNIPIIAAFCDQLYVQNQQAQTRAVFAYDERLALLPSYLQQLEMESNGKSVTADGSPLTRATSPIVWGGVGTDAQHAVFQLLHQGTHMIPTEFLAVKESGHSLDSAHHEGLLRNCFAQSAALMAGRSSEDGNRHYPGNRPSSTILLDDLDARTLGALIAFYEHRCFANAALLGINPFDQFGVELGKEMANQMAAEEPPPMDPSTNTLINLAFGTSA